MVARGRRLLAGALLGAAILLSTAEGRAHTPPAVLHWCAQHCSTWRLDNGPPFDKPHYGNPALGSMVIVERFTRGSVIMLRTDYRPYPGRAILTGQIAEDGNRIVNGIIRWTYHPCCGLSSGGFQAAWGAAIHTVPGSDQERAMRAAPAPENAGTQAAAPPGSAAPGTCNNGGHLPVNSERAVALGKQAALARNDRPAFACFLYAAEQGNASGQVDVGYAYEKGVGTRADAGEARRWYMAAAKQGNTFAQFTVTQFLKNGTGGAADPAEAERWTTALWETRNRHSQVCSSKPVKETIQLVEWSSVGDGAGALLGLLAGAVTGVRPEMANARPALTSAQGSDILQQYGQFHIDLGMATGDFICQTIFTRGPFKDCGDERHKGMAICMEDQGGEKALTKEQAEAAFAGFPQFREMFRARPLADGRYQITLVPTSLQLASVYSRVTAEPVR